MPLSLTNWRYWAFFVPLWMLPLFFALSMLHTNSLEYSVLTILIYSILIRLPHFFSTYLVFSIAPETRNWLRDNWVRTIFIPAVIILLYIFPWNQFYLNSVSDTLVKGARIWGFLHICLQAFGISLLLGRVSAKTKLIIKILFGLLFLKVLLLNLSVEISFKNMYAHPEHQLLDGLIGLGFLIIAANKAIKPEMKIYILGSILCIYPWTFYQNSFQYFLVYNMHHSVNYFGTTYRVIKSEQSQLLKLPWYLIYGGLILTSFLFFQMNSETSRFYKEGSGFVLSFFVIHYYFESFIWRDQNLKLKSYVK